VIVPTVSMTDRVPTLANRATTIGGRSVERMATGMEWPPNVSYQTAAISRIVARAGSR
jgi:hypothetical protein